MISSDSLLIHCWFIVYSSPVESNSWLSAVFFGFYCPQLCLWAWCFTLCVFVIVTGLIKYTLTQKTLVQKWPLKGSMTEKNRDWGKKMMSQSNNPGSGWPKVSVSADEESGRETEQSRPDAPIGSLRWVTSRTSPSNEHDGENLPFDRWDVHRDHDRSEPIRVHGTSELAAQIHQSDLAAAWGGCDWTVLTAASMFTAEFTRCDLHSCEWRSQEFLLSKQVVCSFKCWKLVLRLLVPKTI